MKKNIVCLFLVILVCGIFIYQTLTIRNQSKSIKIISGINSKLTHNIGKLEDNLIAAWQYERTIFFSDSIYDEEGAKINDELLKGVYPKLIFRFSKVDCSKCVVEHINLIHELLKNKRIEYIMICDYSNKRNLGLFKRTNGILDTVYNCKRMLKDEKRTPYFCIYYKGNISEVFFPDGDFSDLTNKYFKEISSKYFDPAKN